MVASSADASLFASPDPGGYITNQSYLGTEETAFGLGWAFDGGQSIAQTSSRQSTITYSSSLPEKPLSAGGGPDLWRVGVTAIEMSGTILPASYPNFLLDVFVNGDSIGMLSIPASGTAEQTAFIDIGEQVGATDVAFRWLNPGVVDSFNNVVLGIGVVQFAASEVPTPGTLCLTGIGLFAATTRRRR